MYKENLRSSEVFVLYRGFECKKVLKNESDTLQTKPHCTNARPFQRPKVGNTCENECK